MGLRLHPVDLIHTFRQKGDLLAATAAGQVARLPVGVANALLRANSGAASGLEWTNVYDQSIDPATGTLVAGALSGARGIAVHDRGGAVFNAAAYGYDPANTAAANAAALDAALAAAQAAGGGTVLIAKPGTYQDAGGHTQPPNVNVVATGSRNVVVSHTGNNTWMAALGGSGDLLTVRWLWQGFTLQGNSGASAKGIVCGNTYRNRMVDVVVNNYTAGVGVQLTNTNPDSIQRWTEGFLFDQCSWRNNSVGLQFTVNGGTNSFSETRMVACSFVVVGSGQVGLDVGTTAYLYGGVLDLKFNVEGGGGTCLRVNNDANLQGNQYSIEGESTGGGTGLLFGTNAHLRGSGHVDFRSPLVNTIGSGSAWSVGGSDGRWGLVAANGGKGLLQSVGQATVSADGEFVLAYGSASPNLDIVVRFDGPSRRDELAFSVMSEQFNPNVAFRMRNRYAFGNQKVFGHPFIRRESGGARPNIIIPLSNRNGGTTLTAYVTAYGPWMSDLTLLPGTTSSGSMLSPEYGSGWDTGLQSASVADGGTIAHGLPVTPSAASVTPSVAGEMASVTALDATNITVALKKHDNTAGTTQTVYWRASRP
jgi:hypothetical protein